MLYNSLTYDLTLEDINIDRIKELIEVKYYHPDRLLYDNCPIIDNCVGHFNDEEYTWTEELLKYILLKSTNLNKHPDLLINSISQNLDNVSHILIDAGVDVNYKTTYGITAIQFASDRQQYDIIKHLIKAGADIHLGLNFGSILTMNRYMITDKTINKIVIIALYEKYVNKS